jgi:hypothetical protein
MKLKSKEGIFDDLTISYSMPALMQAFAAIMSGLTMALMSLDRY